MEATRRGYDPAAARASVQQLAALTDEQAAAEIRAAAAHVLADADAWRAGPRWRGIDTERDAHTTATGVAATLAELPADAGLAVLVEAVEPLLVKWWPAPVEQAVAGLRYALLRPRLAAQCRALLPHLDWITEREAQAGW